MKNLVVHILNLFVILVWYMNIYEQQVEAWDLTIPKIIESTWFGRGRARYKSYTRHKRSSEVQDECPLNPDLLDPQIIKETRQEIEQCNAKPVSCEDSAESPYRTIDGSCNNLEHPHWGKSYICLKRILPFDYADNNSFPRSSCLGEPLTNARLISNIFHKAPRPTKDKWTTFFMEWGQMLSHDLSLNDVIRTSVGSVFNCCGSAGPIFNETCVSTAVPPGDDFYPRFNVTCINSVRTVPCPICDGSKRFHLNNNTAYHDLSVVYGSNNGRADGLRSFMGGMLITEYNPISGHMLPTVFREESCVSINNVTGCYHAGDIRVNQTPFLLTYHTFLMRFHNWLCQELQRINPHWDDERLYQEARSINIAIAQYITFAKYLPIALGKNFLKAGLAVLPGAKYTQYNPHLDGSIFDEYAAMAGRYGHTQVPDTLSQMNPRTCQRETLELKRNFFNPFGFRYGQFDFIAKGMTYDNPKLRDQFFSPAVRDFNLARFVLNQTTGLDLAVLSIVRGRDHGFPGYIYYLEYFFGVTINSFDDLRNLQIMSENDVYLLEGLYKSVRDIDLYSGAFAEFHVGGGLVGPTISAILLMQYERTKFGDRYWFEHGQQAGSFTREQLLEIKRSTLAKILCETTTITRIQPDVFLPPSKRNQVGPCSRLHRFNINLWKEYHRRTSH